MEESLLTLLKMHVTNFTIEDSDSIVTSYVMGILEELVEESEPENMWDCEAFCEMLVAYLPQSEGIPVDAVSMWMLDLVAEVKAARKKEKISNFDLKSIIEETANKPVTVKKLRSASEGAEPVEKKRSGRSSETGEVRRSYSHPPIEAGAELEAGLATLGEMFPNCCRVEAVHCLTLVGGDLQKAAQLVITRAELGEEIKPNQAQMLAQLRAVPVQDEATVKKKIMETYGFVDKETDQRYHRPNLSKKTEDKKMTRYRDGKIVSTKGERFSQVTKEESEEMKKTIKI